MDDSTFQISGNLTQNNVVGDNRIEITGKIIKKEEKEVSEEEKKEVSKKKGKECKVLDFFCLFFQSEYVKILLVIIIGAIAFWALAVCAYEHWGFAPIDSKNIILTLVGILATFVVVSNYIQVKEVEKKFDEKSKKYEDALMKISILEKDINGLREQPVNKYLYLLPDIQEIKGILYEGTDPEKAIAYYLRAIEMAVDRRDKARAVLFLERVSTLWENRDCVKQVFRTHFIIVLMNLIKSYPNYTDTLLPEFEEFERKVNQHNNNT
jgi:hypothetical protein